MVIVAFNVCIYFVSFALGVPVAAALRGGLDCRAHLVLPDSYLVSV
jgi:hypothetical protein